MVLDCSLELPARLAAVCVTAADNSRDLRLRDVVQLLAAAGPVYHALHSYSAAGELILVFFEDHKSAQQATSAFHLAHLDATSRLHVQLVDKQQLHGLLQLLVRASQTAGLISADVRASAAPAATGAHLPAAAPSLSLAAPQPGWAQPCAPQPGLSQPFGPPAGAAAAAEKQRATRQLAAAAAAAWGVQAPAATPSFGGPGGLHLLAQLPPASLQDEPSLLAPASPIATSSANGGPVAVPGAVGGSSSLGLSWSSSSLQGLSAAAGTAAANGYPLLAPTDRGLLGSSIGSSGSGSLQPAALVPSSLRASPPPILPGLWQQEQQPGQQQRLHHSFELERVPTPTQRAAAAAPAAPAAWQQQQQEAQGQGSWHSIALPSGSAGSQQALLQLGLQSRLPSSSLSHSAASSPHASSSGRPGGFRAVPDSSARGGSADAEMLQMHLCAAALRRQHDEFLADQAQQAQQRAASPADHATAASRELQPQPKQPCWSAVAAAPPAPAAQRAACPAPAVEVEPRVLTVPRVHSQHQQRPQPAANSTAARTTAEAAAPPAEQGWEEVGAKHSGAAAASAAAPSSSGDTPGSLGRKLYVKHVLQNAKPDQIRAVFGKFGSLEECVKFPEVSYAFVTYRSAAAAAAAFAHLNEEAVPSLSGTAPLWIEFRGDAGSSSGGSTPRAGAGVKGASSKSVSKGAPAATFEGSIARDPVRCPLPSKKHEGDSEILTTKLWVGGISGDADEGTLKRIFGRYGPVYGIELRPAPEPGRRDQWAFVNFRGTEDSKRAFEELVDRVIPELTGNMRLKLRFKVPLAPSDRGQQSGGSGGGGGKKGKGARH